MMKPKRTIPVNAYLWKMLLVESRPNAIMANGIYFKLQQTGFEGVIKINDPFYTVLSKL